MVLSSFEFFFCVFICFFVFFFFFSSSPFPSPGVGWIFFFSICHMAAIWPFALVCKFMSRGCGGKTTFPVVYRYIDFHGFVGTVHIRTGVCACTRTRPVQVYAQWFTGT